MFWSYISLFRITTPLPLSTLCLIHFIKIYKDQQYIYRSTDDNFIESVKALHGLFCSFFSLLRKHGILKNLRSRKDTVIVRTDKGSGVVIMERNINERKISEIINNTER